MGKIGIWILMDRSGKALKLEQSNEEAFTFAPKNDFLFSAGVYESPIENVDVAGSLAFSKDRHETIQRLCDEGKIEFSMAGMKALLSYHCSPGSVCRHEPYETTENNTQSARIIIPCESRYLITEGPCCMNPFEAFSL